MTVKQPKAKIQKVWHFTSTPLYGMHFHETGFFAIRPQGRRLTA
jgi:hypothetical protein